MDRPLAVVTGASSGIGAVFARALAARGYDLVLVARRRERLEALQAELGTAVEVLQADLTDAQQLGHVEEKLRGASNLQLLVNNAGFGTRGRFFETPLEGQDQMYRLHVLATMRLTHAALKGMVARSRGGIINVSSVAGFWQSAGNISYCSTKGWMNSFTEGLYQELKSAGSPVKVQALCPGFTYTEFHDVLGTGREGIPRSFWTKPEDVVEASLRGLERGQLFVVPGARYRAIVAGMRLLPASLRRIMGVRYGRRARRF